MARLFLSNIPYDCQDNELQQWIESQGFAVDSLRTVRDQVSGVSPAFGYVSVHGSADQKDPIETLDGQQLNGRKLQVREDWRNEHHCR